MGALLPGRQFQDRRKPFRAWAFHGEVDRGGARGECVSDEPARGRKHIYIPAPGGKKRRKLKKSEFIKFFNLVLIFLPYIHIIENKICIINERDGRRKMSMKKRVIAGLAAVLAVGVFTGCGAFGGKDIGRDAALEAALGDAGVDESDTTRLKVSEDYDDGRKTYEVRFDADGKEYDYEIAAADGAILSAEVEVLDNGTSGQGSVDQGAGGQGAGAQDGSADGSASGNAGNTAGQDQQTQNGAGNANVAVTMEQAISIALERVPGATEKDVKIELDYDDGVYKYEGDIIHEQREYDFEIDANTGTILEWSEERA